MNVKRIKKKKEEFYKQVLAHRCDNLDDVALSLKRQKLPGEEAELSLGPGGTFSSFHSSKQLRAAQVQGGE